MIPLRSRILDTGVRVTFHTLLLLSLFLLFRGHNQPGGGFAGGLVAGGAFVLVWAARGVEPMLGMLRVHPESLVGWGLLVALATALGGLVFAGDLLESGYLLVLHTDAVGKVAIGSALVFDTGIYLLVLGFVTLSLERLGTEVPAGRRR